MSKSQNSSRVREPRINCPDLGVDNLVHLSKDAVLSIMKKDIPVPSRPDMFADYIEDNFFQYYIGLNAWCLVIEDIAGSIPALEVRDLLLLKGAVKVIASFDDCADEYIRYIHDGSGKPPLEFFHLFSHLDDPKEILTCLRYLKRFTLVSAPWLVDSTYAGFMDVVWRCNWRWMANNKYETFVDRDPDPSPRFCSKNGWLEEEISKELDKMIPKEAFIKAWEESSLRFSSGVCINAKTIAEKMRRYSIFAGGQPTFDGIPYFNLVETNGWSQKVSPFEKRVVLRAVPKNYKKYRVIAPEHSYNAAHMQRIQSALRKVFPNYYRRLFNVHDQSENRKYAAAGSTDGTYVTIDLTSASDSISRILAKRILPSWLWEYIAPYLADKIEIPKGSTYSGVYTNSIFLTSGNPNTFELEGRIFLAIMLVARKLRYVYTHHWCALPVVYGDDIVIPSELFDEALSLLSMLGFTVNTSKTFAYGTYRESCGIECFRGMDISGIYWPRKEIRWMQKPRNGQHDEVTGEDGASKNATTIIQLCEMQHKLVGYRKSNYFFRTVIRSLYPRMSSSPIGSELSDLWEYYPKCESKYISCVPLDYEGTSPCTPVYVPTYTVDRTGKTTVRDYSEDTVCANIREVHTVLSTEHMVEDNVAPERRAFVEMYYYYDFLAHGPQYDNPLSELLGVSSPRNVIAGCVKPQLRLRNKTI